MICGAWFKAAKAPGMNATSASIRQLKRINMPAPFSSREAMRGAYPAECRGDVTGATRRASLPQ